MIEWISFLEFLELRRRVKLKELIDAFRASTDFDEQFLALYLNVNSLCAKLIDTLLQAEEHKLHLATVWQVVDVLGESSVNRITLGVDKVGDARLKINDIGLECIYLRLVKI